LREVIGVAANCQDSDNSVPQTPHIALHIVRDQGQNISSGVLGHRRTSAEIEINNIPLEFSAEVS
jgi:hypothetical protein